VDILLKDINKLNQIVDKTDLSVLFFLLKNQMLLIAVFRLVQELKCLIFGICIKIIFYFTHLS